MLNIILKSGQNKIGKCDVFGGPVKMKRAWKQIARKQNKVCHAAHLIIYRLDKPPMLGRKLLGKGHRTRFAYNGNLHLSGVSHLVLNLCCNLAA